MLTPYGLTAAGAMLLLLLLTIVYGILVFWRLGSSKVPITFQELEAKGQEDELVLDLGEETEVAQISIYLGHMTDRVVSVSWYDEEQGKWIPLEEEITMESNAVIGAAIIDNRNESLNALKPLYLNR